jgi:hypothetical protein
VPFSPTDPAAPHFRLLSALPGMRVCAGGDPLVHIWPHNHRRCILIHTLLRGSAG